MSFSASRLGILADGRGLAIWTYETGEGETIADVAQENYFRASSIKFGDRIHVLDRGRGQIVELAVTDINPIRTAVVFLHKPSQPQKAGKS